MLWGHYVWSSWYDAVCVYLHMAAMGWTLDCFYDNGLLCTGCTHWGDSIMLTVVCAVTFYASWWQARLTTCMRSALWSCRAKKSESQLCWWSTESARLHISATSGNTSDYPTMWPKRWVIHTTSPVIYDSSCSEENSSCGWLDEAGWPLNTNWVSTHSIAFTQKRAAPVSQCATIG